MQLKHHLNQLWQRKQHTQVQLYGYICFAVLRLVLVFVPQRGYVHPDEFFQMTEVMTGEHFRIIHTRTWEFNNTMPLRSMTLPFLLLRVPWSFVEFFAVVLRQYAHIELLGSYTYLVFPRLIMCCISFLNDWSLYRICRLYSLPHESRLLALASSYVMLVFGTRTFSNTIEMALCALLLQLVAECMLRTNSIVYKQQSLSAQYRTAASIGERVKLWRLQQALPAHHLSHLWLMSSICVVGVFNRPTFLLFGAPMVFYWLLRGLGSPSISFTHFNMRIVCFCACALPALLLFIFGDSLYYKYLTSGELHMLDIGLRNFVFTPWNFLKYNLDAQNTAQHGLHSCYTHLLVNVPLLYNILGLIAVVTFAQQLLRFLRADYSALPRAQSIVGLLTAAIFVPLCALSLFNHQEARFLLPCTLPLLLLHAPKLWSGFCAAYPFRQQHRLLLKLYKYILCRAASAPHLLRIWYVLNIALTVFFGFVHQAGVFPLAQRMESLVNAQPPADLQVHLVTSHIYSLPLSFVNIPNIVDAGYYHRPPKPFWLYEYGSLELPLLVSRLQLILSRCDHKLRKQQPYRLLLALPTSLSAELATAVAHSTQVAAYMSYDLLEVIYPHLSTEALPNIYARHLNDFHPADNDLSGTCAVQTMPNLSAAYVSRQFSAFVHQFGLALYEFKLLRKKQPQLKETQKKQTQEKQSHVKSQQKQQVKPLEKQLRNKQQKCAFKEHILEQQPELKQPQQS